MPWREDFKQFLVLFSIVWKLPMVSLLSHSGFKLNLVQTNLGYALGPIEATATYHMIGRPFQHITKTAAFLQIPPCET